MLDNEAKQNNGGQSARGINDSTASEESSLTGQKAESIQIRAVHTNAPGVQTYDSDTSVMEKDFQFARKKTKSCGRCLFYLGYILLILNVIGISFEFLGFFIEFKDRSEEKLEDLKVFGKFHIFVLKLMEILRKLCEVAQAIFMIKMTKQMLKQVASQEANPRTSFSMQLNNITKYEKIIATLILVNIILKALNSYYVFSFVDTFLADKYQNTYEGWKKKEMDSLQKMQYGADKIKVDDNFLNEMKKDVTKELSDVEVFDEAWNSYGPFVLVLGVAAQALTCMCVCYCIKSYKKYVTNYESSPVNPANKM